MGFFKESLLVSNRRQTARDAPKCWSCGLYKQCNSPKMPVSGSGGRRVLIVAEAPGGEEDERGTQLIGKAGQYLRKVLSGLSCDLDRDCWKTNALICRPPENRTPTSEEIEACRPNLLATIEELQPEVIILCGAVAVRSLIGWLWKEDVGSIGRWIGFKIPSQELNAWVCPVHHPSHLCREDDISVAPLWFEQHLSEALQLRGRPWEQIPDYAKSVEVVFDDEQAAGIIREMAKRGGPIAIDLEANRLKPEPANSKIICCGLSWRGRKNIAFPWWGQAVDAVRELIWSNVPMIAANLKFEERWFIHEFGRGIRNWVWDTMQAAHVLDNRPHVTSVKFQSFVLLGEGAYDGHISEFLSDTDDEGLNKAVEQIDGGQLMQYCAVDAKVEYEIAVRQAGRFGVEI